MTFDVLYTYNVMDDADPSPRRRLGWPYTRTGIPSERRCSLASRTVKVP